MQMMLFILLLFEVTEAFLWSLFGCPPPPCPMPQCSPLCMCSPAMLRQSPFNISPHLQMFNNYPTYPKQVQGLLAKNEYLIEAPVKEGSFNTDSKPYFYSVDYTSNKQNTDTETAAMPTYNANLWPAISGTLTPTGYSTNSIQNDVDVNSNAVPVTESLPVDSFTAGSYNQQSEPLPVVSSSSDVSTIDDETPRKQIFPQPMAVVDSVVESNPKPKSEKIKFEKPITSNHIGGSTEMKVGSESSEMEETDRPRNRISTEKSMERVDATAKIHKMAKTLKAIDKSKLKKVEKNWKTTLPPLDSKEDYDYTGEEENIFIPIGKDLIAQRFKFDGSGNKRSIILGNKLSRRRKLFLMELNALRSLVFDKESHLFETISKQIRKTKRKRTESSEEELKKNRKHKENIETQNFKT